MKDSLQDTSQLNLFQKFINALRNFISKFMSEKPERVTEIPLHINKDDSEEEQKTKIYNKNILIDECYQELWYEEWQNNLALSSSYYKDEAE